MNAAPSRVDPLGVRRLVPEILDRLPATDPRAIRSRRDLHRINRLMRQAAIADKMIRRHLAPGNAALNILELGAGDGRTVLRLARRLARHRPAVCLTLLDMAPTVAQGTCAEITALGWQVRIVTADAFSWLAASDQHFDLAITNLFLRRNGKLLTPPLASGLLPGVLRQSLLDSGEAVEAFLMPADLDEGELFMGNALRGLIPAQLIAG